MLSTADREPLHGVAPAEDCFAELVRPHLGCLLHRAEAILGSADLAWDAVQETLLTLWRQPERPSHLRPWLLRVVANRSLHLLRTHSRRRKHEERAHGAAAFSDREDPCRILANRELERSLEEALAELADEQRTVFILRELDLLDYEAIADRLQVPLGTVRSRLNRARAALRERLQHTLQTDPDCWFCRGERRPAGACPPSHHSPDN